VIVVGEEKGRGVGLKEAGRDFFRTKRQLQGVLARAGVHPSRRLGQNFLIDRNLAELVVRTADLTERSVVMEVGTGVGMLTGVLAQRARQVVSVEVDGRLLGIARERLADCPNVTLVGGSALEKHRLSAEATAAMEAALGTGGEAQMVANLPYSIASPVLVAAAESELGFQRLTVTVQKEVAERVTAHAGVSDRGILSVLLQLHGHFEIVRVLSPKVFWPRPKVESAILDGVLDRRLLGELEDYGAFKTFVKAIFAHRRKKLLNSLGGVKGAGVDTSAVAGAMERLGLSPNGRGQELSVEELVMLFREATGERRI